MFIDSQPTLNGQENPSIKSNLAPELKLESSRKGMLFETERFKDTKDPCPVFDGKIWHIFGSGGDSKTEIWKILHATAPSYDGPWKENEPVTLEGLRGEFPHIAAPGVVFEDDMFHMFVQEDFKALGGKIEHLTSSDGNNFKKADTPIDSILETDEACVYDPHPAEIKGKKYLTYSGARTVGRPDLFLAESESDTWNGPWNKFGKILSHEQVPHHNQHDHEDYEWGLEGSQLIELPNGLVLMNAVCFLPEGERGTRQRVFFAIANDVKGPYHSLGTVLLPGSDKWENGENGHASGFIKDDKLVLFYQARGIEKNNWRYGIAEFDIASILSTLNSNPPSEKEQTNQQEQLQKSPS